jgi:ribosomal protein S14
MERLVDSAKARPHLLFVGLILFALLILIVPFTAWSSDMPSSEVPAGNYGSGGAEPVQTGTPRPVPTSVATVEPNRVRICHRTGAQREPYREITINRNALRSHLAHGDIYPVPPGGCPRAAGTPIPTSAPRLPDN